jgi:hypothetical protein
MYKHKRRDHQEILAHNIVENIKGSVIGVLVQKLENVSQIRDKKNQ